MLEQFGAPQRQSASTAGAHPIDVKLRIFIPSRAVLIALPVAGEVGFDGDNRGFSYDSGTSRAELWVDGIYSDQSNPIRIKRRAFGESKYYVKSKIVDVPGKPFWWKAVRMLPLLPDLEEAYDGVSTAVVTDANLRVTGGFELPPLGLVPVLRISFLVNATNPLEALAPAIDCELNLFLMQSSEGHITFSLKGEHDGFPAYELYVNRQRLYSYDPVAAGKSPLALAPPTDVMVDIAPTLLTVATGTFI